MSVFQLTIDLNEFIRRLNLIVADAANYSVDIRRYASDFKQQLGRSEFLVRVAGDRLLNSSSSEIGTIQREAINITFDDIKRSYEDLKSFFSEDEIGTSPSTLTTGESVISSSIKSGLSSTTRRIRWAIGRKSTADKLIKVIERSNKFLWTSLQDLELLRDDDQSPPPPTFDGTTSNSAQTILTTQRIRLGICRGRIPLNRNILRRQSFLDLAKASVLEKGTSLRTATYAASRQVLIEGYEIGDNNQSSERKAIQLAMLLSQPKVPELNVFKCEGLVHDAAANRYEFIFDMASITSDLKEDGFSFSTPAEQLAAFRSLNFRLTPTSEGKDTNDNKGDCHSVFRYSNAGANARYWPMSLLERLTFARSLAQTISTLHLAEWVHGNMNSKSILFFQDITRTQPNGNWLATPGAEISSGRLGRPYLFGFQFTRLDNDYSDSKTRNRLSSWNNFYRHPERQVHRNRRPQVPHKPLHDIYSLGVIFLEIGLGHLAEDLIEMEKASPIKSAPATQDISYQGLFLDIASRLLPERMGEWYTQLVIKCLAGDLQRLGGRSDESEGWGLPTELQEEVTLSTAFWISVIEPLNRLIEATSPS
ncbi:uncharacterized protein FTOL_13134 [Fusarium torulosum]|uniref:Protein kinase domain-containing protein n=1 Tax=Fusarium torulosum TaxID=33205 RepID=A0AAE8MNT3_9HYPO|nr:uncharacterized protein FTOL_13134 [Fusarium torulosum]